MQAAEKRDPEVCVGFNPAYSSTFPRCALSPHLKFMMDVRPAACRFARNSFPKKSPLTGCILDQTRLVCVN